MLETLCVGRVVRVCDAISWYIVVYQSIRLCFVMELVHDGNVSCRASATRVQRC